MHADLYQRNNNLLTLSIGFNLSRFLRSRQLTLIVDGSDAYFLKDSMETIRKCDIPSYLRASPLCESFDAEGEFDVPVSCFKRDCSFRTEDELKHLLRTLRYWCVERMPVEVFEFLMWAHAELNLSEIAKEFHEFGDYFGAVGTVRGTERASVAKTVIYTRLGVDVLRVVRLHGFPLNPECCEAAAEIGDLDALKYLWSQRCRWNGPTVSKAAMNGHMECLQYAVGLGCRVLQGLPGTVAESGPVCSLQFLHEHKYKITPQATISAAKSGNLACLRYLGSQGFELHPKLHCLAAACTEKFPFSDPVGCLKYLHEEAKVRRPQAEFIGSEYWEAPILHAARVGNLDCLAYMHESGDLWTDEVSLIAAKNGHLHCLKYTNAHGIHPFGAFGVALDNFHWKCVWFEMMHGHRGAKIICTSTLFLVAVCLCCFHYMSYSMDSEEFVMKATFAYIYVPIICSIAIFSKKRAR